jgi:NTP pyrophosphatase (non-canonical NTP hydrolase)
VRFDMFQSRIEAAVDEDDELLPLLGIGAHAGALLDAHARYLGEKLDRSSSTIRVSRELGLVLRNVAEIATSHDLQLDDVARRNLVKIRGKWARRVGVERMPRVPQGGVRIRRYQELAALTDLYAQKGVDPRALSVPMLGLAGEAGTLLVAQKKAFRDTDRSVEDPDFVSAELGDVLWYTATVARHCGLDLQQIAADAADGAEEEQRERAFLRDLPTDLPVLDEGCPDLERIPRRLVIRFQQQQVGLRQQPRAHLTLVAASPNAFPDGPIGNYLGKGKPQGFNVPDSFGATLSDNSRRVDHYRFHDALHLGFLAVLGWSPVTRSLLQLKRRSDEATDEDEDGARAIFAEEGMAAVLAKRAAGRQEFRTERSVDDETLEMLTTVLEDLEVSKMPAALWRRAIVQGFAALRALTDSGGGYLIVDLEQRSLTFSRTNPTRRRREKA